MPIDLDQINLDVSSDPSPPSSSVEPRLDDPEPEKPEEELESEAPDPPQDPPVEDNEEEDGEEPTLIRSLIEQSGYDFGDAEFEDTTEGYFQLAERIAEKRFESQLEQLREENPVAAEFFEHISEGGDPAAFQEAYSDVDYSQIQIPEDDEGVQKEVVRRRLVSDGYSDEQIQTALARYEAAGLLKEEAQDSLTRLQALQYDQRESLREERLTRQQEMIDAENEFVESVTTAVKKATEIKGVPITEKDKDSFINFITKKDPKTGLTGYAHAVHQMSDEDVRLIQYLTYKGLDLSTFIKNQARSSHVESLSQMANRTKNLSGMSQNRRPIGSTNVDDLELNI
jgi:hypothetical protein